MKITSVRRQKRRRDRINVYVDGEFRLSVATEVAMRRGLRAGRDADEGLLARLLAEDAAWRAKEAALHLLSYRQRGERELRDRLVRKGFDPETVEGCVGDLRQAGLLDDRAFASAFVRDRLRSRPSGSERLISELRRKGIEPSLAESVVEEVIGRDEEVEVDLARRAVRKFRRRAGEEPARARRRLYGFLGRRGFSGQTIHRVAAEIGMSD